jgi:hypothetical protein
VALPAALAFAGPQPASLACGYHDDVSLARGMLNWVYPDALHVTGAVSMAVAEQRLAQTNPTAGLFGAQYRATLQAVDQLADALRGPSEQASDLSFSLVLIEPMLWTRFAHIEGKLVPEAHVSGPRPGDLVVVSGEAVIRSIASGILAIGEARRLGLIRLYGTERQMAQFLDAYAQVGRSAAVDRSNDTLDIAFARQEKPR